MENTDQAEANHARALRSFHSAKEHWLLKGHWAVKEKGIYLHLVFWVVGLQVLFVIAAGFILLPIINLSGMMSDGEIDELLERSKRLQGVIVIAVTAFAYRLTTGTYKGLGLFLGKLWGTILLSGLGILAALSVAPLVRPVLGEEITFILLGGIPALIFFIFAVVIWPKKFFYEAVEKARNAATPLSG